MSHMFCTLQEAAQTLNASEDQIKALLERGLLHEFRQGPHRLLKEADVGALALKQRRHHGMRVPGRPGKPYTKGRVAYSYGAEETGPRHPDRRPSDRLSVRQWLWMGLVQDRPVAIALLAGLVLSLVAALVAGLYFLAQVS
jgi:excisionase family DNA binding protein